MFWRKEPWKSARHYVEEMLPPCTPQIRLEAMNLVDEITARFPSEPFDYQATRNDEYDLEQRWVSRSFGNLPWTELIDKPVRKNLSLLYSLDAPSFVALLPAALVTGMCDDATMDAVWWQLRPGSVEFVNRMELVSGDRFRLIRKWLEWSWEIEHPSFDDQMSDLNYYWGTTFPVIE